MSALDLAALRGLCERRNEALATTERYALPQSKRDDALDEYNDLTSDCADALPAAVAEIERLRARVGELETALHPFVARHEDLQRQFTKEREVDAGGVPHAAWVAARDALRACPGSPLLDGGR